MNVNVNVLPPQPVVRDMCVHPTRRFIEFSKEELEQPLTVRFRKVVMAFGSETALTHQSRSLSYDALDRASNQVARAILDRVGQGEEAVVLLLEHGLSPIVALWGVLKAGKIYVELRPTDPPARLQDIISDVRASLIVTDQLNKNLAARLASSDCRLLKIEETTDLSAAPLDLRYSSNRLAAIFYTSGSTGAPKGVVHSHRSLHHIAWRDSHYYRLGPGDRYFNPFVCGFIAWAVAIFDALLTGAALHLYNVAQMPANQLASQVLRDRITFFHPTLPLFRQLLDNMETGESPAQAEWNLRYVALSGDNVYKHDVERFQRHFPPNCRLLNRFSSTETGVVTYLEIDRSEPIRWEVLPAGYATPDTEILLLDDNGYNVSAGQVGEIAIKSRYHAAGYWQREELTKTRFLPDPEGGDRRVYLTGDLGRRQADGCVEHLGRKDFQAKVRGYTVSMGAIEAALLELEAVKEALVVARENQTGNHQLVAYLVPSQQAVPTVTALRRVLAQTLPTYMIPTAFVTLKSLPLTATGKIDRRSLPDPDRSRPELDTLYVSPRSPLEKKVAQIWAEVLSVEEVGIHDNFFDLGGHSVAATRVLSQVIQKFQLELPLQLLFQSPTVAEMAAVIAKHQGMNPGGEELARILTELESLSDEEATSQLGEAMRHRRQV